MKNKIERDPFEVLI